MLKDNSNNIDFKNQALIAEIKSTIEKLLLEKEDVEKKRRKATLSFDCKIELIDKTLDFHQKELNKMSECSIMKPFGQSTVDENNDPKKTNQVLVLKIISSEAGTEGITANDIEKSFRNQFPEINISSSGFRWIIHNKLFKEDKKIKVVNPEDKKGRRYKLSDV